MPSFDLNEAPSLLHLRTLVRVADHRTFSGAARKMLRTASVVHDGIVELERQLGVALFERFPGGWQLTPEGTCVLCRARRILAELAVLPALLGQPPVTVHEQLYLLNARRLVAFVILCRVRNMGRVAKALAVTQPAISSAVKTLETGTDKVLFERSGRGAQPTEMALAILPPITRALNELGHIEADLAALHGRLSGKVRVGALPLSRTRLLPVAVVALLDRYPHVQVETFEGTFEQLETDLRAGDLDVLCGALRDPGDSELTGELLLHESLVIVVRSGHPLLGQASALADLHAAQWIMPRPQTPARRLVEQAFQAQDLELPMPCVESGDMAIIRGLLARSDWLALVSRHQFETDVASGELAVLPVELPATRRPIGLITRRHALHPPAVTAMIEALRATTVGEGDSGEEGAA